MTIYTITEEELESIGSVYMTPQIAHVLINEIKTRHQLKTSARVSAEEVLLYLYRWIQFNNHPAIDRVTRDDWARHSDAYIQVNTKIEWMLKHLSKSIDRESTKSDHIFGGK